MQTSVRQLRPEYVKVPLPGGGRAVFTSSGLNDYTHVDWQGSARFGSTTSRGMLFDMAYAPYGEIYAKTGGGSAEAFTGQYRDIVSDEWDFLYRQEHSSQGRWISPDPAGLAAVDPMNPQTWNRYAYVGNDPCNSVDPFGLDTCTLDIQVNNNAGLTDPELQTLESRISAVFGSAQWNGNSVQAQFSFGGSPDFTLNVSPNTSHVDGYSGWPLWSPTIYWGNIKTYPNAAIYGGTDAAHEIVHRGVGPRFDLWGQYNPPPNLMNVNQAAKTSPALAQQVATDWSNPSIAAGFASLNPKQVEKLYKKCTKAHHTGRPVSGSGKGGYGGSPFGIPPGWDEFDFLGLLNEALFPGPTLE